MNERVEKIVEVLLGALFLGAIVWGAWAALNKLFPGPPGVDMSLSAYFEGSQLIVKGQAQPEARQGTKGKVRVTIVNLKGSFQQSVIVDIKPDSTFASGAAEAPAFRELKPDDPLEITAEVHMASGNRDSVETIYLHAKRPPQLRKLLLISGAGLVICIVIFFWAFTGPPSLTKDRVALILSYCMILMFLILPLAAPVVMARAWGSDVMDTAVGFVITRVPQKDAAETARSEPQWALNIGGYVHPSSAAPAEKAATPADGQAETTAAAKGGPPAAPDNTKPSIPPAPDTPLAPDPAAKVIDVQGGLVIPLYVVILSVIGGAINMTRKVPDIQGSAPVEYTPIFRRMVQFMRKDEAASGTTTTRSVEVKEQTNVAAAAPDAPPAASAAQPETDGSKPASTADANSDTVRTQRWRIGLLNLYMYLISAPFLAIVTYYLLWWLDLTKVPILVLVSFSIGLMSDQVVNKILGVVQGALDSQPKNAANT